MAEAARKAKMDQKAANQSVYVLLKEISILSQLATAEFNRTLPDGLHVSHFALIEHLAKQPDGQTPNDLARIFQVSKQNITNSVAQLTKRGFVEVADHPSDRRSKIVRVSEQGKAFRAQALAALAPLLSDLASHRAYSELEAALPAIQAVRQYLDGKRS